MRYEYESEEEDADDGVNFGRKKGMDGEDNHLNDVNIVF